jgi:hypothetical protein
MFHRLTASEKSGVMGQFDDTQKSTIWTASLWLRKFTWNICIKVGWLLLLRDALAERVYENIEKVIVASTCNLRPIDVGDTHEKNH